MRKTLPSVSNCWFRQLEISLPLNLKPTYLLQPLKGVHVELKQMLLKYVPELGGVLLGWSHVRFEEVTGDVVLWMVPSVRVHVRLTAYVCVPLVSRRRDAQNLSGLIRAKVKSVGQDYVALTALHHLHITVPRNRVPPSLFSQLQTGASAHELLQVAVCRVNVANDMMTLVGSLLEPNTGLVRHRRPAQPATADTIAPATTTEDVPQLTGTVNMSSILSLPTDQNQKNSTGSPPTTDAEAEALGTENHNKATKHKNKKEKTKKKRRKNKSDHADVIETEEPENSEQQDSRRHRKKRMRSEGTDNRDGASCEAPFKKIKHTNEVSEER
jgi:hypothetical protein